MKLISKMSKGNEWHIVPILFSMQKVDFEHGAKNCEFSRRFPKGVFVSISSYWGRIYFISGFNSRKKEKILCT